MAHLTVNRKTETEKMNEAHVAETMAQIKSLRYQSYANGKPWLDADGRLIWSHWRMKAAEVVFSQTFETCMGVVILSNLVLIMYEANKDAQCYPMYYNRFNECPDRSDANPWLVGLNISLLIIYSIECVLRAFVERSAFIWNKWNMIDLFAVVSGWVGLAISDFVSVTLLRMFRLVRVVRALRVLISVPEFYLLITGLASSIKAIFFGALMLASVIVFWAVISVELLHPIASRLTFDGCDRCAAGFETIFAAALTLFQQIVAGDNWGQISIPVVEEEPLTAILLFSMLITISLGMLNLILAVIVERAAEARENDHEAKIKRKEEERAKSMEDLASLCASMDVNNNGLISLEEMLKGYDEVEEFKKLMQVMDLKREDMAMVFNVLDSESTQEVSYLEFCQHLGSFFKRDPVIMHSLVKYSIMELRKVFAPLDAGDSEVFALLAKAEDLASALSASVATENAEALHETVVKLQRLIQINEAREAQEACEAQEGVGAGGVATWPPQVLKSTPAATRPGSGSRQPRWEPSWIGLVKCGCESAVENTSAAIEVPEE
ncbi:Sodium channel protein type 4 subunit alpha A (Voltage-gated sodium channel subunit alpha Nav1.4a) [Durusdinium trenchii]|uniref:Sodium channel protein type 4 subunit alpha A (Voltage-gated sodium channel subunit alpha Nav1.4a) n=1 Tax=Durusdinium trenchii TaxID=1381693 RepID=A0ABP0SSW8_9DINO